MTSKCLNYVLQLSDAIFLVMVHILLDVSLHRTMFYAHPAANISAHFLGEFLFILLNFVVNIKRIDPLIKNLIPHSLCLCVVEFSEAIHMFASAKLCNVLDGIFSMCSCIGRTQRKRNALCHFIVQRKYLFYEHLLSFREFSFKYRCARCFENTYTKRGLVLLHFSRLCFRKRVSLSHFVLSNNLASFI